MNREIGIIKDNCKYIHYTALYALSREEIDLVEEKVYHVPNDFDYDIIEIDLINSEVKFIHSKDWLTSKDPELNDYYLITKENNYVYSQNDDTIIHHKWQLVMDDYDDFNIEESKRWSEYWTNHPIVKVLISTNAKKFYKNIVSPQYWDGLLYIMDRRKIKQ